MRIHIQLFASLRRFGCNGQGTFSLDLPEASDLNGLVTALRIPPQVERVILVNGRHGVPHQVLRDDDQVVMFPPMTGG